MNAADDTKGTTSMLHNPKLIRRTFGRTTLIVVTLLVAAALLAGVIMLLS
ncbi:hypothetical protein AB0K00_25945 [Dactylosporangium sp. NPDC049525]